MFTGWIAEQLVDLMDLGCLGKLDVRILASVSEQLCWLLALTCALLLFFVNLSV